MKIPSLSNLSSILVITFVSCYQNSYYFTIILKVENANLELYFLLIDQKSPCRNVNRADSAEPLQIVDELMGVHHTLHHTIVEARVA